MYTLTIKRDYSNYSLYYKDKEVENDQLDITKLLTGDVLDNNFELIESPLKKKVIPAIIKLDKPFQYLGNKVVYKCYPHNKLYPVFFVDVDASINALSGTLPSNPITSAIPGVPASNKNGDWL